MKDVVIFKKRSRTNLLSNKLPELAKISLKREAMSPVYVLTIAIQNAASKRFEELAERVNALGSFVGDSSYLMTVEADDSNKTIVVTSLQQGIIDASYALKDYADPDSFKNIFEQVNKTLLTKNTSQKEELGNTSSPKC